MDCNPCKATGEEVVSLQGTAVLEVALCVNPYVILHMSKHRLKALSNISVATVLKLHEVPSNIQVNYIITLYGCRVLIL